MRGSKSEAFADNHLVRETVSKQQTGVESPLAVRQLWIMDASGQVIN